MRDLQPSVLSPQNQKSNLITQHTKKLDEDIHRSPPKKGNKENHTSESPNGKRKTATSQSPNTMKKTQTKSPPSKNNKNRDENLTSRTKKKRETRNPDQRKIIKKTENSPQKTDDSFKNELKAKISHIKAMIEISQSKVPFKQKSHSLKPDGLLHFEEFEANLLNHPLSTKTVVHSTKNSDTKTMNTQKFFSNKKHSEYTDNLPTQSNPLFLFHYSKPNSFR